MKVVVLFFLLLGSVVSKPPKSRLSPDQHEAIAKNGGFDIDSFKNLKEMAKSISEDKDKLKKLLESKDNFKAVMNEDFDEASAKALLSKLRDADVLGEMAKWDLEKLRKAGKVKRGMTLDDIKTKLPEALFKGDTDSMEEFGRVPWTKEQAKELLNRFKAGIKKDGKRQKPRQWAKDKLKALGGLFKNIDAEEVAAMDKDTLVAMAKDLGKEQMANILEKRAGAMKDLSAFLETVDKDLLLDSLKGLKNKNGWKKENAKDLLDRVTKPDMLGQIKNWKKAQFDKLGKLAGCIVKSNLAVISKDVFNEVGKDVAESIKNSREFRESTTAEKKQTIKDMAAKFKEAFGKESTWDDEKVEAAGPALGEVDLDAIPDGVMKSAIKMLGARKFEKDPERDEKLRKRLMKPGVLGQASKWLGAQIEDLGDAVSSIATPTEIKAFNKQAFKDGLANLKKQANKGRFSREQIKALAEKAKDSDPVADMKTRLKDFGAIASGFSAADFGKLADETDLSALKDFIVRQMDSDQLNKLGHKALKLLNKKARKQIVGKVFKALGKEARKALVEAELGCSKKCPAVVSDLKLKFAEALSEFDMSELIESVKAALQKVRTTRNEKRGTDVATDSNQGDPTSDESAPGFAVLKQTDLNEAVSRRMLIDSVIANDISLDDYEVVVRTYAENIEAGDALAKGVKTYLDAKSLVGDQNIVGSDLESTVLLAGAGKGNTDKGNTDKGNTDKGNTDEGNGAFRAAAPAVVAAVAILAACA